MKGQRINGPALLDWLRFYHFREVTKMVGYFLPGMPCRYPRLQLAEGLQQNVVYKFFTELLTRCRLTLYHLMADVHTTAQRSYNMSRIKGKNTRPEMLLRRFLHAHGFR